MSHFLNIPINENGIVTDLHLDEEIGAASQDPFKFTDVFIYSHGWWTSDADASADYNRFSIGLAKTLQALAGAVPPVLTAMGQGFSGLAAACYWPSVLSEDPGSLVNLLEATSFFTMGHRAESVGSNAGYTLLRLLIQARKGRPPLRFNLIGHSFGCRVVLSALQKLTRDAATLAMANESKAVFRVALIQAATDDDCLGATGNYPDVLTDLPNLRVLLTTSSEDAALGTWYPRAEELARFFSGARPAALGSVGPKAPLPVAQRFAVETGPGNVPSAEGSLTVADISPLHKDSKAQYVKDLGGKLPAGGQHSDIFLPKIYELVARFTMN